VVSPATRLKDEKKKKKKETHAAIENSEKEKKRQKKKKKLRNHVCRFGHCKKKQGEKLTPGEKKEKKKKSAQRIITIFIDQRKIDRYSLLHPSSGKKTPGKKRDVASYFPLYKKKVRSAVQLRFWRVSGGGKSFRL